MTPCPINPYSKECRCGEFCIACIWSTPRSPENHARALRRVVEHCALIEQVLERMKKAQEANMEFIFTLKFILPEHEADMDALLERLGVAGCDDALAGIGLPGRLALEFTREATSARDAVFSALADVRRALPEARLAEAAPDIVGLSDVAGTVGVSRQNMRKLMLSHGSSFPAPIHDGSTALWHLDEVLDWLRDRAHYRIDEAVLDVARVARQVNLARDARHALPQLQKKLHSLLGQA